jgi:hypothetical protein
VSGSNNKRVSFKIDMRTKANHQGKGLKLRQILILLGRWLFTHNIKNRYPRAQDGGIWHPAPTEFLPELIK